MHSCACAQVSKYGAQMHLHVYVCANVCVCVCMTKFTLDRGAACGH